MTGLSQADFLSCVIYPALDELGPKFNSVAARNLLFGTAIQESGLTYLKQLGGGPALGLYQMEPATHDDIWKNFLSARRTIRGSLGTAFNRPDPERMVWDLKYATQMARLHYWRVKEPLPHYNDIPGMARYWKKYYNTPAGAGTEEEFIENWNNH